MNKDRFSTILSDTKPAHETLNLCEIQKSFVLRLWCDSTTPHWHATLMSVRAPHTTYYFANLTDLTTFLLEMRFVGGQSSV
jgi:hypothetical protein